MKLRRILALAGLAALLAAAGLATWRSTHDSGAATVEQVAASLRCPACDGETVAQSRSPVAAAMREVIANQLAAGRSPDQVRTWFAQRYGEEVLADPSGRGMGSLLWIVPGLALLAGVALSVRTLRHRPGGGPPRTPAPPSASASSVRTRRAWDLAAVGVLAMVAAVAVAGARAGGVGSDDGDSPAAGTPAASTPDDALGRQIDLAKALEQQGEYGAAVEIYRAAAAADPDPRLRLRLAFALLRAGRPGEAAGIARQVLADQPADADGLLVLGLAERATRSPAASGTLRRFLRLAPDHPAAADVRRLLSQQPTAGSGPGG
jgi:cytochrome c-type biogenesis protein CcmH/NrfF